MTRDEVLERLDRMASFWAESDAREGVKNGPYATALRAAAEIIRASWWRPIAEFTDENEYLTGGRWDDGRWYEYSGKLYWLLAHRCTHARVSPAPPAREVENG